MRPIALTHAMRANATRCNGRPTSRFGFAKTSRRLFGRQLAAATVAIRLAGFEGAQVALMEPVRLESLGHH